MALRSTNALSKYKSLSRPSISGGFSSYSTSLVKKTASAEDAIIDNQYSEGLLSAENYLLELQKRTTRSYITPLQLVNLQEKMDKVQETVMDAQVDKGYASGQYTTDQVLQYEKNKLSAMTEPNSAAYIKQAQKVQELTDKSEREKRTAYRVSTNLQISKMPEDTSARLYAKALEYEKLEAQARVDGDTQQADTFAAQKNNYLQSAKRGDINDLIVGARQKVSQTPTLGLGVPSAEKGQEFLGKIGGSTGFDLQNPAIKNALESLDSAQNRINNLYQQKADKQTLIQTYQQAVNSATGDQKTQLTIALNNLTDDIAGIDNSIANVTQNIQDTVVRISEIQAKQAASAFSQDVRRNNLQFDKVENELETALAKGKINKDEYLSKGIGLAETKALFFNQVSDGFSQFGNDLSAESYLEKANQMEQIHESLINVGNNLRDYELVAVDPGGRLNNLFGKSLKPGDFALTNIRQLKDNGVFDSNYVKVGNAFYRVHYPGEISDSSGLPLSPITDQQLAQLRDTAFIYRNTDKESPENKVSFATFLDENNKPIIKAITKNDADKLVNWQVLTNDPKKGLIQKPVVEPSILLKAGAKAQETLENTVPGFKVVSQTLRGENRLIPQTLQNIKPIVGNVGQFIQKNVLDRFQQVKPLQQGASSYLQQAGQNLGDTFSGVITNLKKFFTPKQALAASGVNPVADEAINRVWGKEKDIAHKILEKENAKYEIALDVPNRINPETGQWDNNAPVAQKYNPFTGKYEDSVDRGLFRINNGTFYDFLNRQDQLGIRGELNRWGISSWNDMNDPVKNAAFAKIVKDIQGLPAWYAVQPELTPEGEFKTKATPTPTATPVPKVSWTQPSTVKTTPTKLDYGVVSPIPGTVNRTLPEQLFKNVSETARSVVQNLPSTVSNIQKTVQPVIQNIQKTVSTWQPPKISIPQFSMPKIEIPKPVQQVAQNVGNTVRNVVQNVSNLVKKFKFW